MKIHLFISSHPMRSGETVAAVCGAPVEKAQIVYAWDDVPVNTDLQLPSLSKQCQECWRLAKTHKRKGYTYAVLDGKYRRQFKEA